ncbi:MAG: hypothetical protein HOW97_31365 [Catenulispora sp.]|nr:hypothetical protein [Catenulispora sp.]
MTTLTSVVIEVLGHPRMLGEVRALAARMIAIDEEINHILARTKGTLARPIWAGCAAESDRGIDLFVAEWERFKACAAEDGWLNRRTNPGEVAVLKEAVAACDRALERLRQEFARMGKTSWVYGDDEP